MRACAKISLSRCLFHIPIPPYRPNVVYGIRRLKKIFCHSVQHMVPGGGSKQFGLLACKIQVARIFHEGRVAVDVRSTYRGDSLTLF